MSDSNNEFTIDLDGTFDADESLLVSPPKHTINDSSFENNEVSSYDDTKDHHNSLNQSIFSNLSSSFTQTPIKPQFSYASAMDAIDDLAPSAIKTKQDNTMLSLEHSSAKKALEANGGQFNDSLEYSTLGDKDCSFVSYNGRFSIEHEYTVTSMEEQNVASVLEQQLAVVTDDLTGSFEQSCSKPTQNLNDNHLECSPVSDNETSKSYNKSSLTTDLKEVGNNNTFEDDDNNKNNPCNFNESHAFSVPLSNRKNEPAFRYPCIRHENLNEDKYLELKLGHPVNESFDGSLPKSTELENISMEVEHDAIGTFLDDSKRVEYLDGCIMKDLCTLSESNEHKCAVDDYNNDKSYQQLLEETPAVLDDVTEQLDVNESNIGLYSAKDFDTKTLENIGSSLDHAGSSELLLHDVKTLDPVNNYAFKSTSGDASTFEYCDIPKCIQEDKHTEVAIEHYLLNAADVKTSDGNAVDDPTISDGDYNFATTALENESETASPGAHDYQLVHTSFEEENTSPSFSAFSETLSPIAKSSSPHNCDDNVAVDNEEFTIIEKAAISPSDTKVHDSSETDQSKVLPGSSDLPIDAVSEDAVENAQIEIIDQGTIFDVLSRPVNEVCQTLAPEVTSYSDANDLFAITEDTKDEKSITGDNLELNESSTDSNLSASSVGVCDTEIATTKAVENLEASNDSTTFQDTFNSTSNALLQKLRGAAETRKREVTRCRYSLERKEQIMMDEKEVRATMPTVGEDEPIPVAPSRRTSMRTLQQKKIEGLNPYKPFIARPIPSTTRNERPKRSSVSISASKSAPTLSTRNKLAHNEDASKPFTARPFPSKAYRSNASKIGTKRKMSIPLRPRFEHNKSSINPLALNGKPPKRLLSGRDASLAKENSLRERIEKENAKAQRESQFKALPLPSSTQPSNKFGENLRSYNNSSLSSRKKASSIQPFMPHSTRRAEERAAFDSQQVERQNAKRTDRKKRTDAIMAQVNKDIEKLKDCIR